MPCRFRVKVRGAQPLGTPEERVSSRRNRPTRCVDVFLIMSRDINGLCGCLVRHSMTGSALSFALTDLTELHGMPDTFAWLEELSAMSPVYFVSDVPGTYRPS